MKLLTAKIKKSLPALRSTVGVPPEEKKIMCKFFNPVGAATWYIAEGSQQEDGDWLLFGYADLGYGGEWGYSLLSELQSIKLSFGLGIERDIHFSPQTITL